MDDKNFGLLKDKFLDFVDNYGDIYDKVKNTNDWKNPYREIVSRAFCMLTYTHEKYLTKRYNTGKI